MKALRVGHLSTLYHTSIVMQAVPGLLEEFPLDIHWRLYGTGPAIVEAFKRGEIDLAYIGLPPAIIGMTEGVDIVCVAGGHVEGTVIASGADASGYPETDDLAGILSQFERIGVPGRGSIHDLIINDLLYSLDVPVEVVNLPWADEVLESFMKGGVDAVVGTPALAEAVIYYGGGRIVYPPERLWPDNPSYGILVDKGLLERYRDAVRMFLQLHEKASWLLRKETAEVASAISGLLGMVDRDFVLGTLGISPHYCATLTEAYIECTMRLGARMRELGYIKRLPTVEEIFDLSLVEEIHPEDDHYRETINI